MNADIFLVAAELEFDDHEYSCLCIKVAGGDWTYTYAYADMFSHDTGGWWLTQPNKEPNDEYNHQARTYALLLTWAMTSMDPSWAIALEDDL